MARTLLDPLFARRNHFNLDWTGAWRLGNITDWREEECPIKGEVVFEDPGRLRPERLIAQGPGVSRIEAIRRIKRDIPLHRPTSAGFTFTVTATARG